MNYLIVAILFLSVFTLLYAFFIIQKKNNRIILMVIYTMSMILTNVMHILVLNKLFLPSKYAIFENSFKKGIDFKRTDNLLGVNKFDANDAKTFILFIICMITYFLLVKITKQNIKNGKNKNIEYLICAVCTIIVFITSLISSVFMALA